MKNKPTETGIAHKLTADCPQSIHVYDWLNLPPIDDAEKDAKEWLDKFTLPAYIKHTKGVNEWLSAHVLTVEWKGRRYICSGASRMGDVWLRGNGSSNYYDHRVSVAELSNWNRQPQPAPSYETR